MGNLFNEQEDRKLLEVYQEAIDESGTLEDARDSFEGIFENEMEWAEENMLIRLTHPRNVVGFDQKGK